MKYYGIPLKNQLNIEHLMSFYHFYFDEDYKSIGERHNFWEIVYVKNGNIGVTADTRFYELKTGMMVFHKPNEFHTLMANGVTAPNILIVSFNCESEAINFFENRVANIGDQERRLLATIIAESENAFSTPLDDPWTIRLERSENAKPGCEQFIKIGLEWLLLSIMRNSSAKQPAAPVSLIKENSQNEIFDKIVKYMEANLDKQLLLSEICRDNLVGRSYLQKLFREKTGGGAIDYFNRLKINAAKRMIRESSGNFTEISMKLGYNSIHYFSRQFKSMTGMTLSEYASSVKILTGKQ